MNKKDDTSITVPLIASMALHLVLFAILVIKPVYPLTGDAERLDSIWFYFNQQPSGQQSPSELPALETATAVNPAGSNTVENKIVKIPDMKPEEAKPLTREQPPVNDSEQPRKMTEIREETEPVTELITAKVDSENTRASKETVSAKAKMPPVKAMTIHKEKPVEEEKPVEDSDLKDIRPATENKEKTEPEKNQASEIVGKKASEIRQKNISSSTREIQAVHANTEEKQTQVTHLPGSEPVAEKAAGIAPVKELVNIPKNAQVQKVASGTEPVVKQGVTSVKVRPNGVGAVSEKKSVSREPGIQSPIRQTDVNGPAIGRSSGERKFVAMKGTNGPVPAEGNVKDAVRGNDKPGVSVRGPAEKTPENKGSSQKLAEQKKTGTTTEAGGVVILPMTGDLKLEIDGNTGSKITVSFKEYLKSHRNRPMTRAEAKRVQKIKPVTRTVGKVVEAVVGTTGEGVYEFVVTPGDGNPVTAVFKVKIYEDRSKAKTKLLGTKTIKEKTVIARILMPEGIFWDDDSYFSGYLEDSDSVTKYNSDNGLIWKEYNSSED